MNEWAARRWWPDQAAVGRTVRVDMEDGHALADRRRRRRQQQSRAPDLLLDEDGPSSIGRTIKPVGIPAFFVAAASRPEALLRRSTCLLALSVPDRPVFSTLVRETVTQQLGGVRTNAIQIRRVRGVGLLLACDRTCTECCRSTSAVARARSASRVRSVRPRRHIEGRR